MRLRSLHLKDVSVRLTETGFVETVRWFGLLRRSVHYEMAESRVQERAGREGRSVFVRARPRGEQDPHL